MKRISLKMLGTVIRLLIYINFHWYMRYYVRYLKRIGVRINGSPGFIAPDAKFDGTDYSLISIGHKSVISIRTLLLTHDFSLYHALYAAGYEMNGIPNMVKGIHIGNNSFIGASCMLLPGTHIGNDTIVGAGSVVRGKFPDGVILVGNPAIVVAQTVEWINKKVQSSTDYSKFIKN